MHLDYHVYGLSLQSNIPIPGLEPRSVVDRTNSVTPDLRVVLGSSPEDTGEIPREQGTVRCSSDSVDQAGNPVMEMRELAGGAFLHLAYDDGARFWFDRAGARLWATWPAPLSIDTVSLYLLGPILGLLLRFRRIVCLHASAVALGDRAAVFVGPEEAGKSTTAAALTSRGCSLLSEDVVPLTEKREGFLLSPGYAHLRLWPETVTMLYGASCQLPQFIPEFDKRRLSLSEGNSSFCDHPTLLGSIYLLGDRNCNGKAPYLEEVSQRTALISLVANTYASDLIDSSMRAEEFAVLGRLVSRVPVRQIHAHEGKERLSEICDLICKEFQVSAAKATA